MNVCKLLNVLYFENLHIMAGLMYRSQMITGFEGAFSFPSNVHCLCLTYGLCSCVVSPDLYRMSMILYECMLIVYEWGCVMIVCTAMGVVVVLLLT